MKEYAKVGTVVVWNTAAWDVLTGVDVPQNEIRLVDTETKIEIAQVTNIGAVANAIRTAQQWHAVVVAALNSEIGDLPTSERLADAVIKALGEQA